LESQRYFEDCAECEVLWADYTVATREHFRLENNLEMAGLRHDREAVQDMLPLVEQSSAARSALRTRIAQHLEERHPLAKTAAQG